MRSRSDEEVMMRQEKKKKNLIADYFAMRVTTAQR